MENYTYNGKFSGNILIVGRTECGKTSFMQRLALFNFFGEIREAEWISGIKLTEAREAEIQSNFSCDLNFSYPSEINELESIIEELKIKSRSEQNSDQNIVNKNDVFGEKSKRDKLIVFDDVSGLADDSKKFASFLTVARKYNYNCVYIFHTIYPEKANWRTILSQTNIYNIFPATVPLNNVRKILESACIRKTSKYIPHSSLWISRLFIELANRNDKVCLTLDCSNTNKDGPGRFRTEADNPEKQVCYFNSSNDEQVYNEFLSECIKGGDSSKDFHFKIIELRSKTNKDISFNAREELREIDKKHGTSANSTNAKRIKLSTESVSEDSKRFRKRSAITAKPGFLLK